MIPQRRRPSFASPLAGIASCVMLSGCLVQVVPLSREDAGSDAAPTPVDSSPMPVDAGPAPVDASPMPVDASPMPTDVVRPDVPATGGLGSVDLLVVIDDSNSMRQAQDVLNANLGSMVLSLLNTYGARDVHVGIVTSNLGTPGATIPSCASPEGGDLGIMNPRRRGPATTMRMLPSVSDNLFCQRMDATEPPYLTLTPAHEGMFTFWAPSCQGTVGVGGCGLEQQLESAYRALTVQAGPAAPNAGFLRPEATLAILVFSDEEDGSVRDCRFHDGVGACSDALDVFRPESSRWASGDLNLRFYNYVPGGVQDPTWPVDRYVDTMRLSRGFLGLKPGHPERVVFGAITGVPNALPQLPDGNTDWATLLGIAADGSDGYVAMSPEGPVSMRQRNMDPLCSTRVVPACRRPGTAPTAACDLASQYFAWPARRLAEVARRLDVTPMCGGTPCHNGMVASICDANDASAFGRFAAMIGRRVGR